MILRRIIEHVTTQNWTAVVLDFFIVVLGVFLGIQIGNWNDARRDRETEHTYFVRLQQELAEILPEAEAEYESIRAAILSFDQANETMSQLRTDIQIDRQVLSRHYPNLIRLGLTSWGGSACDFRAMSGDQAFLNDYADNLQRFNGYLEQVMTKQAGLLKSLSSTLDSGKQG